jgi:hypothetical protein
VADVESVRIELAFEGGQIIAAIVSAETADALERAIAASASRGREQGHAAPPERVSQ